MDNVGRRYLIEHTEAEDGSWWYDRYSDGWLVQSGIIDNSVSTTTTLPVAFESPSEVSITMSLLQGGDNNAWASDYVITMLSGTQITGTSNQVKKIRFIAQGYAA